jgi:ABC-type bacteriocin/lantibiotic exporter with double-glycine peptidase domain
MRYLDLVQGGWSILRGRCDDDSVRALNNNRIGRESTAVKLPLLSTVVEYYSVFRRFAGPRLLLLVLLTLLASLLAGLGLSMVIPLFEIENSDPNSQNPLTRVVMAILAAIGVTPSLPVMLVVFVFVFLLKALLLILQTAQRVKISSLIQRDLQLEFADAYTAMSYGRFTHFTTGYLTNAITTEIIRVVLCFQQYAQLLAGIANVVIFLAYAALLNWQLPAAALVIGLMFIWPAACLSRYLKGLSLQISSRNSVIQQHLLQLIENYKYLKATSRYSVIRDRLIENIRAHRRISIRGQVLSALPMVAVEPIVILVIAAYLLYLVGYQGGSLVANAVAILLFDRSIRFIFRLHTTHQRLVNNLGGLITLEAVRSEIDLQREVETGESAPSFSDQIRLSGVDFSFGDTPILKNLSLTIARNQYIGIVGESGAGKTTLFDLLTGLLTPSAGKITFDGHDYQALTKSSLRDQFGYVTQEPVIFNDSVRSNITLWDDSGDNSRLIEAARLAHADGFIGEMEHNYDSEIGDRGIRLSGGQKQRLAIAREIYRDPAILFFDEATSSLDSESEKLIQDSIRTLRGAKTLVLITHRIAAVKTCDWIYILHSGEIVQQGSWDTLISDRNGRFYQICQAQGIE